MLCFCRKKVDLSCGASLEGETPSSRSKERAWRADTKAILAVPVTLPAHGSLAAPRSVALHCVLHSASPLAKHDILGVLH